LLLFDKVNFTPSIKIYNKFSLFSRILKTLLAKGAVTNFAFSLTIDLKKSGLRKPHSFS